MGFFNALNHLVNFFLPALTMALLVPTLARLVWRAELKGKAWRGQVKWSALANAGVLIVGFGSDRSGRCGGHVCRPGAGVGVGGVVDRMAVT